MRNKIELTKKQVEQGITKILEKGKTMYFVRVSRRTPGPNSRRLFKQGRASTLLEARRLKEAFWLALKEETERKASPTLREFLPEYMRYLEGHRRASTVFRQTSIIQAHILPALADRPLAETSVEELEELVDRICAGKSAQTKKHFISYLSDIFRRALKKGLIAANPVDRIDRPRVVKKDQLVLTEAEARKLLAHLRENYPVMFYHAAIALHTLCRAGELRALTWADIDWEGRQLSVSKTRDVKTGLKFRTKNSETRKIPINDELLAILKELRSQTFSAPSDPILPVWREFASGDQGKPLKIVCKSLQLPEIRFHDLRASGITILLLKGVPAPKVMLLAGHRRLSSIQHYLRASGREAVGATDCLQLLDEDITPGIAPTSSDPPSDNFTPVPPDNVVKPEES